MFWLLCWNITSHRSKQPVIGNVQDELNYYGYNHDISAVDAETSSQEDYGLKYEYLYNMRQLLIALLESIFLDLLLHFLKFKEKFVDLHQMLHLVTDGFFDICNLNVFVPFVHLSQPYFQ